MSTKKEKPCCDRCREVSSISGSFNCVGTCQCHQSESIEWDKAFDEKFGKLDAPTEQIKAFLSQAITTAVAKREKELVDEVEKLHHLHNPPEKELIYLTDVIAILKH